MGSTDHTYSREEGETHSWRTYLVVCLQKFGGLGKLKRTGKICGIVYPVAAFSFTTQPQLAANPHISPTKIGQRLLLLHRSMFHRRVTAVFAFQGPWRCHKNSFALKANALWLNWLVLQKIRNIFWPVTHVYLNWDTRGRETFVFPGVNCWSNESGYTLSNLLLTQNIDLTVDNGCTESVLRVLHGCPLSPLILAGVILQQFVA